MWSLLRGVVWVSVVRLVTEVWIRNAEQGDQLAHRDVLSHRHCQFDELSGTELVHEFGEELIVDRIVVVPKTVGERECGTLAASQPWIVELAVLGNLGQVLLDILLSRPGEVPAITSIVALVQTCDPKAGDLLDADLEFAFEPKG
jgi:hypothetical protein